MVPVVVHRRALLGVLATTAIPGSVDTAGAATDCEASIVEEEFDVYEDCESEQLHGAITVEGLDCEDPLHARAVYTSKREGLDADQERQENHAPMSRVSEESEGSTIPFEVLTKIEGYTPADFSVQVLARSLVVDERSVTAPEHPPATDLC